MNNKVTIQGNKIKVLEGYQDNDQMSVLMVLLIIKYSVTGNTLSVPLKKVAFIFDAVKKQVALAKLATLLSSPWEISGAMRKKIILAHEKNYLIIKDSQSVISFSLSDKGIALIEQVETLDIVPQTRKEIKQWCKDVKISELKNQHLIW
jgi:hypothetical protein